MQPVEASNPLPNASASAAAVAAPLDAPRPITFGDRHVSFRFQPAVDVALYSVAIIVAVGSFRSGTRSFDVATMLITTLFSAAFAGLMMAADAAFGMYRGDAMARREAMVRATGALLTVAGIGYFAVKGQAPKQVIPADVVLPLLPYMLAVAAVRPAVYVFTALSQLGTHRILLVGGGERAIEMMSALQRAATRNTKLVGLFEAGPAAAHALPEGVQRFARSENLWDVVARWSIDEVIVAVQDQRGGVLPIRELLECRIHGVRVSDETALSERLWGEFPLQALKASWMIYGSGFEQGLLRKAAKRCTDVAASALLLVLALPVMLLTALAIKFESAGPVLYLQERVGRGGRTFKVMKFRSMRVDAEKDGVARWATRGDSRITRIGKLIRKTRIDELPQLINVLQGEMSIVGPRPERPTFVDELKSQIRFYDVRHSVKPGLTGWAQVRYNYAATLEDSRRKLQYDLYYVKNHTLWLDLRILIETVRVVLFCQGAH